MELAKEILEKQANLQVTWEFYKQQRAIRGQKWMEVLCAGIQQEIHEVAQQKGLDLVLEKDRLEVPVANAQELGRAIRARKLLYCSRCIDLTSEVMSKIDVGN